VVAKKTFGQLLDEFKDKVSPTHQGERREKVRIELVKRDDIAQVMFADPDESHFAAWRDRQLKTVGAGSVRREWNLLSSACNYAVNEWRKPLLFWRGCSQPV
jgi:hypothetical protein